MCLIICKDRLFSAYFEKKKKKEEKKNCGTYLYFEPCIFFLLRR